MSQPRGDLHAGRRQDLSVHVGSIRAGRQTQDQIHRRPELDRVRRPLEAGGDHGLTLGIGWHGRERKNEGERNAGGEEGPPE